jgi:hypothetical protein
MDNLHRSFAVAALMAAWLLGASPATAQDSSPYVVGHWKEARSRHGMGCR